MTTLKTLVDETTNIKNELVECHTNLKNNLSAKGVEVSSSDKMSNLVDKVKFADTTLNLGETYCTETTELNYTKQVYNGAVREYVLQEKVLTFNGSVRAKLKVKCTNTTHHSNCSIRMVLQDKNGVDKHEEVFSAKVATSNSSNYVTLVKDFTNIKFKDKLILKFTVDKAKTNGAGNTDFIYNGVNFYFD